MLSDFLFLFYLHIDVLLLKMQLTHIYYAEKSTNLLNKLVFEYMSVFMVFKLEHNWNFSAVADALIKVAELAFLKHCFI